MRGKLTLNLEDLSVDSFDTTATQKPRGTVIGEQCTCYTQCTCPGCPTCDQTCNSCDFTCAGATCPRTCGYTCDDETCLGCGTTYDSFRPCTTAMYTYCEGQMCL
ncbi:MAG TPA: hypothetical protein VGC13_09520 [Longimicrobium sp.]|jgi:hypothetical protein|uniref:hypothetical protein n=1 Tax=Longimicrobium sp. TaxID=2029185 RepID=UPI002EDA8102